MSEVPIDLPRAENSSPVEHQELSAWQRVVRVIGGTVIVAASIAFVWHEHVEGDGSSVPAPELGGAGIVTGGYVVRSGITGKRFNEL
ncbi:MAG TPA: hypothetical protein VG604_03065 [Candidatus Saccharimonadales bacterium]|nr:hypothetical protein [Candidatus Saccharimonadales bacterium]